MDNQLRTDAADHILTLRTLVARAGEKDNLGWWDSDALSPAGSYVLQRIFPRSAVWAGIRLAIEAATIRHSMILGNQPALSLFALGEEWDSHVGRRLVYRYGKAEIPVAPETVQSSSDLLALLQERGKVWPEDGSVRSPLELFESNTMEVGQVRGAKPLSSEEVFRWTSTLASCYTRGDRGRLLVPYLRVLPS